jgi:hypothetical protein
MSRSYSERCLNMGEWSKLGTILVLQFFYISSWLGVQQYFLNPPCFKCSDCVRITVCSGGSLRMQNLADGPTFESDQKSNNKNYWWQDLYFVLTNFATMLSWRLCLSSIDVSISLWCVLLLHLLCTRKGPPVLQHWGMDLIPIAHRTTY